MSWNNHSSFSRSGVIFRFTFIQSIRSSQFWKTSAQVMIPLFFIGLAISMIFAMEISQESVEEIIGSIQKIVDSGSEAIFDDEAVISKIPEVFIRLLFAITLFSCMVTFVQTIAKTLMEEKSSKLMETILNEVSPYALVAGKIGAMTVLALLQLLAWSVCTLLGMMAGEVLHGAFAAGGPSFMKAAGKLIELLLHTIRHSSWRIFFCFLAYLTGFVMFCSLAGFFNSFAGKPEDLSNTVGMFVAILITSLLLAVGPGLWKYIRQGQVIDLFNYIPFCAPFCLPAAILLGQMTIPRILISLLLMMLLTFGVIISTGIIYKSKVFFRGGNPFDQLFKKRRSDS